MILCYNTHMSPKPKITFYGGVGVVTGANFLFEVAGKRLLVDCGLEQGTPEAEAHNRQLFPYDPASIDLLFITHAHLDHVGRIGKLVKEGFRGTIYSTPETKALAELIMDDAVGLLAKEAERHGVLPIYEAKDVIQALALWHTIPYHTPTEVVPMGENGGLNLYLKDAGHILGSSMMEFTVTLAGEAGGKGASDKRKVVFTGDLGNSPTPLLKNTEVITDANYLIMESVYGDRNHEPVEERKAKLKRIITESIKRGGVLVIPAFSLERTQVILYELNSLVETNQIPSVPIFVDSPLATKVTEIYKRSGQFFNAEAQSLIAGGDQLFNFPRLKFTVTTDESRHIQDKPGAKIILAGSGMSSGGRVTHHEITYLPDPKSTILLVGYQSLGTLGRRIENGDKVVTISGQEVKVRAHVETIYGYSSHKDSDRLVAFVEDTAKTLKKVFVVMGEPKSSLFLAQKLRDNLDVNAVVPERAVVYELD